MKARPFPPLTAAQQQLAAQYVPLAKDLARRFARQPHRYVDRDDLDSAALLGLVLAAQAFRPADGWQFTTYASTKIQGALLDVVRLGLTSNGWSRTRHARGKPQHAYRVEWPILENDQPADIVDPQPRDLDAELTRAAQHQAILDGAVGWRERTVLARLLADETHTAIAASLHISSTLVSHIQEHAIVRQLHERDPASTKVCWCCNCHRRRARALARATVTPS